MIFSFLKYLQPVHYFTLKRKSGDYIFPVPSEVDSSLLKQFPPDKNYSSEEGRYYDLSWRLLKNGYIGNAATYKCFSQLPLRDEYYFARKNFNRFWVLYVLFFRCLSLKNPFKETSAYRNSGKLKCCNQSDTAMSKFKLSLKDNSLLSSQPKVSVVIPTLNRYTYLKDALADLEGQNYENFDVFVIDQSDEFNEDFYKKFSLDLKIIRQQEKALWLARNRAVIESDSDYLLFFDDDSRVKPNWIETHLNCIDHYEAEISSGVSISRIGAKVPSNYSFYRISDQLDTGNALIKKSVFEEVGLFDRQFEKQRMGDGEFGLRAYLAGLRNVSNPEAKRIHLKVPSGGLREMGSWDAFRTNKLLVPRPIPSVLYFFRKYFGNRAAKLAILRTIPFSIVPYKYKSNKILLGIGSILAILLIPVILGQVLWSWRLSSQKLKEGELIPNLNS